MKVVLLKSGLFSFSPMERHVDFHSGDIADLSVDRAELLVATGWANFAREAEAKNNIGANENGNKFKKLDKAKDKKFNNADEEFINKAILDVPK